MAIGTIRVVPMGMGLTLTETLLSQIGERGRAREPLAWEVGRLALAPEYRSDAEALRRCLFLALDYLHSHAEAQHLYASCSHALSRLYRRFGFSAFATDVRLPGTDKSYTLIYGSPAEVLYALGKQREAAT